MPAAIATMTITVGEPIHVRMAGILYTAGFWCARNHPRTASSNAPVDFAATSSPTSANIASAIAETIAMRVQ